MDKELQKQVIMDREREYEEKFQPSLLEKYRKPLENEAVQAVIDSYET